MIQEARQLNPLTKLGFVLAIGSGCLIYPSPLVGYTVLLLLLFLGGGLHIGRKLFLMIAGFGIPATAMLLFIQGFYSPQNKRVLLDLGFAQLGAEGTLYALKISATLLVFLAGFFLFMETTRNAETVAALTMAGVNPKIGYLVLASLNVVPQMQRKIKVIQEAQESRGVEVTGSLWQRLKAFLSLLGPVVLSSLTDAQERGMTLETRGFGIKGVSPTSYVVIRKTPKDHLIRIGMSVFLISSLVSRFL